MTHEEFKKHLEKNFDWWVSKRNRPLEHWLLSLEEWVQMEYNKIKREEKC